MHRRWHIVDRLVFVYGNFYCFSALFCRIGIPCVHYVFCFFRRKSQEIAGTNWRNEAAQKSIRKLTEVENKKNTEFSISVETRININRTNDKMDQKKICFCIFNVFSFIFVVVWLSLKRVVDGAMCVYKKYPQVLLCVFIVWMRLLLERNRIVVATIFF